MNFYSCGYWLVTASKGLKEFGDAREVWSVSPCVRVAHPRSTSRVSSELQRAQTEYQGIYSVTEIDRMMLAIEELERQGHCTTSGWAPTFYCPGAARRFNQEYLSALHGVRLFGAGLPEEYLEPLGAFMKRGGFEMYEELGMLAALDDRKVLSPDGRPIGFEVLVFDDQEWSPHTPYTCGYNLARQELATATHTNFDQSGWLDSYEEAKRAAEYLAKHPEMAGPKQTWFTRLYEPDGEDARPLWVPCLVAEYPLQSAIDIT